MAIGDILIVGGTGTTGRRLVARLAAAGVEPRVASRSGTWRFDWNDDATWDAPLRGAAAMYVVPFDGATLTRPFVERARELGVERIVLLSGRGVDVPGYTSESGTAGRTHIDGEDAVRSSGLGWTILRPAWFAQNFSEGVFADAIRAGELRLPADDGAASFVDADDIAAVAVAALGDDRHVGETYELSGPRALTLTQVVALISEAVAREVRYIAVDPDAFVQELIQQGWTKADAVDFGDAVSPIRRGLDSHISDGTERALGRPARDFTQFVSDAAAAGVWNTPAFR